MLVMGAASGTPEIYGPAKKQYCFACKDESTFMLMKVKKKSGRLLLPFMPSKSRYYLFCPKCGSRFEITADQFKLYLGEINRG